MNGAWSLDVALLILRVSVGYVFLYAAWKNTQNRAAWTWTINETALLFRRLAPDKRQLLGRLGAISGMAMMYGGGISILFGLEPRLGGALIVVFCLLGIRIHAIHRDEAKAAAAEGNAMGWSAYSAHIAAGLKNWALIGAGLVFVLTGAGRYGLEVDYIGRFLGL